MNSGWQIPYKPSPFRVGLVFLALAPFHHMMMEYFVLQRVHLIGGDLYEAARRALSAATVWYIVGLLLDVAALILCCFGKGFWRVIAIAAGVALIFFTPSP
jgi:hypothetical protein